MNLELFGAILAYIGLIWSVAVIYFAYLQFRNLNNIGRKIVKINLNKPLVIIIISIVYLIVFHIS